MGAAREFFIYEYTTLYNCTWKHFGKAFTQERLFPFRLAVVRMTKSGARIVFAFRRLLDKITTLRDTDRYRSLSCFDSDVVAKSDDQMIIINLKHFRLSGIDILVHDIGMHIRILHRINR